MKKLLLIAFLFIGFKSFAQIPLAGYISTIGPLDTYPTHLDSLGAGGYVTTYNRTTRNSIPAARRKVGMMVTYSNVDSTFVLIGGVANSNWVYTNLGILGFTPENVANKATTFGTLNNILYPTTQAVANYAYPLIGNPSGFLTNANEGITNNFGVAQLGGQITTNHTIDLNGNSFNIYDATNLTTGLQISANPTIPTIDLTTYVNATNNNAHIGLTKDSVSEAFVNGGSGLSKSIRIGPTMAIRDGSLNGLINAGPYEASFGTNSLSTVAYVNAVNQIKATYATTAALPSNTYNNGTSGFQAFLQATANGALSVDGNAVAIGDVILVKDEVTQSHNGIYTVFSTGSVSTKYQLFRARNTSNSAYITALQMQAGSSVFIISGATNSETLFYQQTTGTITIGTTAIVYAQPFLNVINTTAQTILQRPVFNAGTINLAGEYIQGQIVNPGAFPTYAAGFAGADLFINNVVQPMVVTSNSGGNAYATNKNRSLFIPASTGTLNDYRIFCTFKASSVGTPTYDVLQLDVNDDPSSHVVNDYYRIVLSNFSNGVWYKLNPTMAGQAYSTVRNNSIEIMYNTGTKVYSLRNKVAVASAGSTDVWVELTPLYDITAASTTGNDASVLTVLPNSSITNAQNGIFDATGNVYYNALNLVPGTNVSFSIASGITTINATGGGGGTGANPTALIGFSPVNGISTSLIRADGAPKADSTVIRAVANSYSLAGMQTKLNNYVLSAALLNHVAGYGISGSNYNTLVSQTWTADTTSATALVSKSRLATNLGGYVKSIAVTTANGISGTSSGGQTPSLTIALGAITPTSTNGVSAATMAFLDATSSVQAQLNGKQASGTYLTPANTQPVSNKTFLPANVFQTPLGTAGTDSVMVKHAGGTISAIPANYYSTGTGLTASNFVYNETPSGTINNSNVTFTLANTPVTGKVQLYKNGLRLGPSEYSMAGATITYSVAPSNVGITDVLLADYLK